MERYGLFKKLSDGAPIWVSFEEDLPGAIARMKELDQQTGLEHFVHDFHSGMVIATSRSQPGSGKAPENRQSSNLRQGP